MSDNIYFAAQEAKKTASTVSRKANQWFNRLYSNGYLDKVRDMWMAYNGEMFGFGSGGHKVTFGGEQGELAQIAVNHIRSIGANMLTMVTTNRPVFEVKAINTDYKSLTQATLGNDLLEYYMREKRLEKFLKRATEYAIVLGTGYVKMEWNATSGEMYDFNESTQTAIYEGDVHFCNLTPYDVVFDTTKESEMDHEWIICRTFKNKFDLASKYPELADKISDLQTKSDLNKYRLDTLGDEETDDVPVYEFFHKRTESMPDGRYLMYLTEDIILMDAPMPYRNLPIYRISPSDIIGTTFGYTPLFDLLPLQDAANSLYSTILSNQHAFGVQSIYVPRTADISMKSLEGGMNLIEGNAKPEPINFTQTPPEVFNFLQKIEQAMETVSGVNAVSRGNPEASLKSGTALALVQSMSLQFMSGLQQQYVQLIEDVGTGLINMLKDFASVPRIAVIAGRTNKAYVEKEFTGDDLSSVNRVMVSVGNPMSQTTAGRVQMATEMIQYGIIKSPEQYFTVLHTGQLNAITDDTQDELLNIKRENEALLNREYVPALSIDQHTLHIKNHRALISDPDLRKDEELVSTVLNHIQEHVDLLRNTDPALLQLIGEQPLGPIGGTPPAPQSPEEGLNMGQAPEASPMGPVPGPAQLPNMPNMPQVPAELLPNPEIQQQALNNVR